MANVLYHSLPTILSSEYNVDMEKGTDQFESEHHKNAESFLSVVTSSLNRFPDLSILVINQTDEDLRNAPGDIQAARLSRQFNSEQELIKDDRKAERESAISTSVQVIISGEYKPRIIQAGKEITDEANKLKGQKVGDTGVIPSFDKQQLISIIGHKSGLKNLPKFEELLGFKFS
jgi:hypothetical protein